MTLVLCGMSQLALAGETFAQARLPSPAKMNAMLDSLERVALTATNPEDRARAALTISGAGRLWTAAPGTDNVPSEIRYPGVVARLARIYHQVNNFSIRGAVVYWMPAQTERAAAATFLAEVAAEEPQPSPAAPPGVAVVGNDVAFPLPLQAVQGLTHMGPEGQASLQRLQAAGTVRETTARAYLEELARNGFRSPGE